MRKTAQERLSPVLSESPAMSGDNGFRFNNDESQTPLDPKAQEPNPE
jgi:hypothetical protein